MDATTLAAALAKGRILYAPAQSSLFARCAVIASRGNGFGDNTSGNLSNGTDTAATFRVKHVALRAATDLRLVFANHYNGDTVGLNNITVKAGLENVLSVPTASGSVPSTVPVMFNGARTVTIEPGCFAVSDPIPLDVTAGQLIYSRTFVSVASAGQKWPLSLFTVSSDFEGNNRGAPGADQTASGSIATVNERSYGPVAVLGVPIAGRSRSVALSGDSILFGSGDYPNDRGWAVRALVAANIGHMQIAKPGEQITTVSNAASVNAYVRRYALSFGCTDVIEAYGRNDYANGRTLAQLQVDKLVIWARWQVRRMRIWTATLIPGTTSTDGWTTTGNQTVVTGESVRLAYNGWVRDGAPILNGSAAATGSNANGTLRAGASGHPLTGYIELADTVESARDSGFWKVGALRTVTDAAISNGGVTLTSATAAFVAGDVGQSVAITGAGAAGVVFNAVIVSVTNGTTAVLASSASTTVSAATCKIGGIYTVDGTHPLAVGHAAMATAVTTTPWA